MNHPIAKFLPRRLLPLALLLLLSACETPINSVRARRFGASEMPAPAPQVKPRAMALSLQVSPDGHGLSAESLAQANALLASQGRIGAQALTIVPLSARGQQLAPRLAAALVRSGARAPKVEPLSPKVEPLSAKADPQSPAADLELQSEALVVATTRCTVADANAWTIHPFHGVGALGCATRANLARMASDPRDLTRPRTLDAADGRAAALAVERYQSGEIRELIDINFDN